MRNSWILYSVLLLATSALSCALLPTRQTDCSQERPCPFGQRCEIETATCTPVADLSAMPLPDQSVPPPPDLGPPPGMLLIPGGVFNMGSPVTDTASSADERPEHDVTVQSFYMDITEVTQGEYRRCVDIGSCAAPADFTVTVTCNWGRSGRENHPVNCVTWNMAKQYCEWRGARLPTEEEWEYVARGTTKSTFPNGNGPITNEACLDMPNTCPVSSYPKTLFGKNDSAGLADLLGNVTEWTSTIYCASYDLQNCTADRAARGGAWINQASSANIRAASRAQHFNTTQADAKYGIRCARNI